MGLDMYLNKKTYVKYWEHNGDDNYEVIVKKAGKVVESINTKQITNIEEEVGYWRKANAVHKWFVDNVQGGVDECQESYVPASKLQELLDICLYIKKDNKLAEELLPTEDGFFFGPTDYDKWYLLTIDQTIQILEKLDLENTTADFYYQASW
jgi:hypothetical protein